MKRLVLSLGLVMVFALAINAQVSTSNQAPQNQQADKQKMEQERLAQEKAQQEQAAAQANNPNAPIIKFDKMEHDYGTIEQNADGNCEFKFTNEGKEPLILSNVRSSCGCTVPHGRASQFSPVSQMSSRLSMTPKELDSSVKR